MGGGRGDSNETLHATEQFGGVGRSERQMEGFREAVAVCGFSEILRSDWTEGWLQMAPRPISGTQGLAYPNNNVRPLCAAGRMPRTFIE